MALAWWAGGAECRSLFGPDDDKQDFRVFDVCFNFDFFRENPAGIEGRGIVPLGTRLFRSRVQLLTHVQVTPDLDPDRALASALTTALHEEVAAMNRENFIVRMHLEAVDHFRERTTWEQLNDADREVLQREVAGLPSEVETDEIESRMFDLTALRMQVALAKVDRIRLALEGIQRDATAKPQIAELMEALLLDRSKDDKYFRLWYLRLWQALNDARKLIRVNEFRSGEIVAGKKTINELRNYRNEIAHWWTGRLDYSYADDIQRTVVKLLRSKYGLGD